MSVPPIPILCFINLPSDVDIPNILKSNHFSESILPRINQSNVVAESLKYLA